MSGVAANSTGWSELSTKQRCRILGNVAGTLCSRSDELITACETAQRIDPVETITSELIPLAAAMKWLRRQGAKTLRSRRVGIFGRPAWMLGVRSVVHRVPLGRVLILGTWNYPLLLPGVQAAQALAAGNNVLLKPAVGTEAATQLMAECFWEAGVPKEQFTVLDSSTCSATDTIESGVDLIVLTGAAETGRKVLQSAAPMLSQSIMELSGCDAVIALPGLDVDRLIDALVFGLRFNGSATCIAPRRLIGTKETLAMVADRLKTELSGSESIAVHPAAQQNASQMIRQAIGSGAVDVLGRFDATEFAQTGRLYPTVLEGVQADSPIAAADIFAPVLSMIPVAHPDDAIDTVNQCRYRLSASVFGPSSAANQMAQQLNVGTVTINDLIAPTADPRLPFGGRGQSGFGVTRGPEGLLAMTATKVVSQRRGAVAPHLLPRKPSDAAMLHGALHLFHADGILRRLAGLRRLIGAVKKQ